MFCLIALGLVTDAFGEVISPISLQDTNGQSLDFVSLSVKPVLYGPFAFVENEMVFRNLQWRRLEGRFTLALPSGASPSRLAMEIQGNLMEGEVLDKLKARKVYRSFLHQRRDPALLEQSQGNLFVVRVFPIESRALVRLVLSYTLLVPLKDGARRLTLPLRGLPRIGSFSFSSLVSDPTAVASTLQFSCVLPLPAGHASAKPDGTYTDAFRFHSTMNDITPDQDIMLSVVVPTTSPVPYSGISLAAGDVQLATLFRIGSPTSISSATGEFRPPVWRIYIDTSASTADTFVVRKAVIEALIDATPGAAEIEVFAFDVQVTSLLTQRRVAHGLGSIVRDGLERRLPLGGTNLEALVDHINAIESNGSAGVGVIVLTDAIPTVLSRESAVLGRRLAPQSSVVVQVGVIGTKYSDPVGGAIAAYGGGRVVHIPLIATFLEIVSQKAWEKFKRPIGVRAEPKLAPNSAAWVWPEAVFDLRPGDEAIVFSGLDPLMVAAAGGFFSGSLTPSLNVSGASEQQIINVSSGPLQIASSFKELLVREVIRAQLSLLESRQALASSASIAELTRKEIVALSIEHRVLCTHTALLVLETEQDYLNFGIPRDALRPILVVGSYGIEMQGRREYYLPVATTQTTTLAPTGTPAEVATTQPTMSPTLPQWCQSPCDIGSGLCKKDVFGKINCAEPEVLNIGSDIKRACPESAVLCDDGDTTDPTAAPTTAQTADPTPTPAPSVTPTVPEVCSLSCGVGEGRCRVEAFGNLNCAQIGASGTCPDVPDIGPIARCPLPGDDANSTGQDEEGETEEEDDDEKDDPMEESSPDSKPADFVSGSNSKYGSPSLHVLFTLSVLLLSQSWAENACKGVRLDASRRRGGVALNKRVARPRRRIPIMCTILCLVALVLAGCEGGSGDEGRGEGGFPNTWEPQESVVEPRPEQRKRAEASRYALQLWRANRTVELLDFAKTWLFWDPANTLVFEYIGKAAAAQGDHELAIRATTSIIEIAPRDSEQLLRGAWIMMSLPDGLPAVGGVTAAVWAERFALRSLAERKDNPNTYRALGLAAWRAGNFGAAADAYKQGFAAPIGSGRYGDWRLALKEEASLFLRTVGQADSDLAADLRGKIGWTEMGAGQVAQASSDIVARFTLSWLSDATTVDLHVIGPDGQECFWANTRTEIGLQYYRDVHPEGLGPQVIVLRPSARQNRSHKGSYEIGVKYFAAGSMGAARGVVTLWQLDAVTGLLKKSRIEPFTLPVKSRYVLPVAKFVLE
jgi:hypothetical protein